MSTLLIVIVAVVVAVAGALAYGVPVLRRQRLQRRFGPEYDRALGQFGSRREAERALARRERAFRDLDIRELPAETREMYEQAWDALQTRFVESPAEALAEADALITRVMHDRGYPTDARERRMEILSVRHGRSLDRYRQGREINRLNEAGKASTEDLRQALLHHRMLFTELLGRTPDVVARGNEVPS
ncbi:hypothetical protein LO772_20390 [Yinghuangia sp. ASG 101]|uniref:hypothetical protein n=1 Tax=Yinghuangia sp. ASG 101 TaxID=2896848 RepID=UPI001E4DC199|nr:hypothetical protein [Yinghuangia sp. ASG 101]UGQ09305.1 hypothetical protein LO772_20390 [Yinghuangia sp. ASG 101]